MPPPQAPLLLADWFKLSDVTDDTDLGDASDASLSVQWAGTGLAGGTGRTQRWGVWYCVGGASIAGSQGTAPWVALGVRVDWVGPVTYCLVVALTRRALCCALQAQPPHYRAEPSSAVPCRAVPCRTVPCRAEPSRAEPGLAECVQSV